MVYPIAIGPWNLHTWPHKNRPPFVRTMRLLTMLDERANNFSTIALFSIEDVMQRPICQQQVGS